MLYHNFTARNRATAERHECGVLSCTNSSALTTIYRKHGHILLVHHPFQVDGAHLDQPAFDPSGQSHQNHRHLQWYPIHHAYQASHHAPPCFIAFVKAMLTQVQLHSKCFVPKLVVAHGTSHLMLSFSVRPRIENA